MKSIDLVDTIKKSIPGDWEKIRNISSLQIVPADNWWLFAKAKRDGVEVVLDDGSGPGGWSQWHITTIQDIAYMIDDINDMIEDSDYTLVS